jgi:hypothetical protein
MGKTLRLAINELASGQVQAFTTVNDALSALENSINRVLTISNQNTQYTITETNFTRNGVLFFTGQTTGINVVFPVTVNGVSTNRLIFVRNEGTGLLTLKTSGVGTTDTVAQYTYGAFIINGVNVYRVA